MTPGDCGSAEHDAETIAEIRRGEAKAAADLIGADYLCLEFRDLAIFNDDESRRRGVECLRATRPDGGLTAPPRPRAGRPPAGPPGRLPVRPRDDQPARPRRLLHGPRAELRDPPVGP